MEVKLSGKVVGAWVDQVVLVLVPFVVVVLVVRALSGKLDFVDGVEAGVLLCTPRLLADALKRWRRALRRIRVGRS